MPKLILLTLVFTLLLPKVVFANSTTIQMNDWGFSPDKIEIKQKDLVIFKNVGSQDHWPASNIHPTHQIYPKFDPKKPTKPQKSWQFKFDKSGTWRFHDHLYPQIVGTIAVLGDDNLKSQEQSLVEELWVFLKQLFTNLFKKNNLVQVEKDSTEIFSDDMKLYSYVKKFGPKQTTQRLFELVPQYGDCHQTAHKAGRFSYEIYGDKAFEQCGGECHSGCYHGATEAYFGDHGTSNLTANLNVLCKSELNPFFSHQCIHGVGHGLMAWSNYQIQDALKSCDLLQKRQDSCWTGVFMENFVGGVAESEATKSGQVKDKHITKYLNSDPQYPCNEVSEKYKSSCYFLQTSRMIQLFGADFAKIADTCAKVPQIYQTACFASMGRDIGGVTREQPQKAIQDCHYAPLGEARISCLTGAAQDSFWDPSGADDAINFCKLLTQKQEKEACYSTIFARAPEVLASKEDLSTFCSKVESGYIENCLNSALN